MAAVAARGAEAAVSVVAIEAIQAATVAAAAAAASVVVIEAIRGAAVAAAAASVAVSRASQVAIAAAASAVVVAMASAVTTVAFLVATSTRLAAVVRAQAPLLQRHLLLLALKTVRMMTRGALDLDQTDRTDRTVYSAVGLLPLRRARAPPLTQVRGVSASHLARAKGRLLFQVVMATMGRIRSATLGATSAMMMRQQLMRLLAAHLLPVLQRRVWLQ